MICKNIREEKKREILLIPSSFSVCIPFALTWWDSHAPNHNTSFFKPKKTFAYIQKTQLFFQLKNFIY